MDEIVTRDELVEIGKELKKKVFGSSYTMGSIGLGKESNGKPSFYIYAKTITKELKQIEKVGYEGFVVHVKQLQYPLKAGVQNEAS